MKHLRLAALLCLALAPQAHALESDLNCDLASGDGAAHFTLIGVGDDRVRLVYNDHAAYLGSLESSDSRSFTYSSFVSINPKTLEIGSLLLQMKIIVAKSGQTQVLSEITGPSSYNCTPGN